MSYFAVNDRFINKFEELSTFAEQMRYESLSIQLKDDGTRVSNADYTIQNQLVEAIRNEWPAAQVITEETLEGDTLPAHNGLHSELVIAVDPLDGTDNYLSNFPLYAISVGGLVRTKDGYLPDFAIIAVPALGQLFYTRGGDVIERNLPLNKEVKVKSSNSPNLLMLTQSFYSHFNASTLESASLPRGARTTGSTVLDILFTSTGTSQFTTTAANLWDFAGALAVANKLDRYFWCPKSGKEKLYFDSKDFCDNSFALNQYYVVSKLSDKGEIQSILRHKPIDFSQFES